ncbi:MAG: hypothetical protein WCF94_02490 [bacterium]
MNTSKIVNRVFFWLFAALWIISFVQVLLMNIGITYQVVGTALDSFFNHVPFLSTILTYVLSTFPYGYTIMLVIVYGICLLLKNRNDFLLNISYSLSAVAALLSVVVVSVTVTNDTVSLLIVLLMQATYLAATIIGIKVIAQEIKELLGEVKDDYVLVPDNK